MYDLNRPIRFVIEIGTSGSGNDRAFTGHLGFIDQGGSLVVGSDLNEWEFDPKKSTSFLDTSGKLIFPIASRKMRGGNGEEITETLELEINVSKY